MRIYRAEDYADMSRKAANMVAAQIILKPDSVLGLATGSTPVGMYDNLVKKYQEGDLDFGEVKTVNLDDYRGLEKGNPLGYAHYMEEHLFSKVNISWENTYIPDSAQEDREKACADYDAVLNRLGAADIQVLGLGHDGHIGFNEPSDTFSEGTQCVDLDGATIQANKRFFEKEEDVPRQAYTMGISTIMQAGTILLLVSGADKSGILKKVLEGPVTPRVPGSILKFHQNVVLIADKAALGGVDVQDCKRSAGNSMGM